MRHLILVALAGIAAAAGTAAADVQIVENVDVTSTAFHPISSNNPVFGLRSIVTNAVYSNVTNAVNIGLKNGLAPSAGTNANRATAIIADDITPTAASVGQPVVFFRWSVVNFNAATASMSNCIRFYADNGAGAPGTLLAGFNFNAFNIGAGQGGTVSFTIPAASQFIMPTKLWAAQFYVNNTQAILNNFGALLYNPVDLGSSDDLAFTTTAGGTTGSTSFTTNSPAGGNFTVTGQVANFGWEFIPAPSSASLLGIAGLVAARRRRA